MKFLIQKPDYFFRPETSITCVKAQRRQANSTVIASDNKAQIHKRAEARECRAALFGIYFVLIGGIGRGGNGGERSAGKLRGIRYAVQSGMLHVLALSILKILVTPKIRNHYI